MPGRGRATPDACAKLALCLVSAAGGVLLDPIEDGLQELILLSAIVLAALTAAAKSEGAPYKTEALIPTLGGRKDKIKAIISSSGRVDLSPDPKIRRYPSKSP